MSQDSIRYECQKEMTIKTCESIHADLLKLLENAGDNKEIVVDANAVESIDTTGLQLLLALGKACQDIHIGFKVIHPSECFNERADLMGLTEKLAVVR